MVILREGSAVFNVIEQLLSQASLADALHHVLPDPKTAAQFLSVLSSPHGNDYLKIGYALDIFSRYGLIFLLFLVGLEHSLQDLKKHGRSAMQVALIGIIMPIILGLLVVHFLEPTLSYQAALFVAATLSATSIGITASVLRERHQLRTKAAAIIMGAAMIDDILGLVILAVVSSLVSTGVPGHTIFFKILFYAFFYFAIVLSIGPFFVKKLIRCLYFFEPNERKLVTAFLFLMLLSWLATVFQLAAIIGAFTAGLLLHDEFFEGDALEKQPKNLASLDKLLGTFERIFAPLFFVLMGMQVKIETFLSWNVLLFSLLLTVAAVLGKMVAGLGAPKNRLLIGTAMIPRGEVGLIFASVGKTLGVFSAELFSAIILMVMLTTLIGPMALNWVYKRKSHG